MYTFIFSSFVFRKFSIIRKNTQMLISYYCSYMGIRLKSLVCWVIGIVWRLFLVTLLAHNLFIGWWVGWTTGWIGLLAPIRLRHCWSRSGICGAHWIRCCIVLVARIGMSWVWGHCRICANNWRLLKWVRRLTTYNSMWRHWCCCHCHCVDGHCLNSWKTIK